MVLCCLLLLSVTGWLERIISLRLVTNAQLRNISLLSLSLHHVCLVYEADLCIQSIWESWLLGKLSSSGLLYIESLFVRTRSHLIWSEHNKSPATSRHSCKLIIFGLFDFFSNEYLYFSTLLALWRSLGLDLIWIIIYIIFNITWLLTKSSYMQRQLAVVFLPQLRMEACNLACLIFWLVIPLVWMYMFCIRIMKYLFRPVLCIIVACSVEAHYIRLSETISI